LGFLFENHKYVCTVQARKKYNEGHVVVIQVSRCLEFSFPPLSIGQIKVQ